jgi:phage shock protein E
MKTIEQLIKEGQATILDVRTVAEFNSGHVVGSKNIPLQEVTARIDEIKALTQPLVLCCASGGRSGQTTAYLSQLGIECYNAGSWMDVQYLRSKS